jgi:hypothetical protein
MLRCGRQIRLTRPEAARFVRITRIPVEGVKTFGGLLEYVKRCVAYHDDGSPEVDVLQWLLDQEVSRCLAAA